MVKIAIVGASGQLAREVLDKLVETKKHAITAMDPAQFPSLPGVTWVQTTYEDKPELVRLINGLEVVLCFLPVHLDPENATQKRLIDAAVEAGVQRFAPSEWATGAKLESSLDAIPWYAGKIEISHYLENLNKEKKVSLSATCEMLGANNSLKVIEYTRFQVGSFMNYLGHPHKTSRHVGTIPLFFNFEEQHAILIEDSLDDVVVWTTVQDIAGVVARAVEYEGEWPAVGGISGSRVSIGEMLRLGEAIGKPFTVDWLKREDLEAEVRKTEDFTVVDFHNAPREEVEAWLESALRRILLGVSRGAYAVTDEWNRILPDYDFIQVEDLLEEVWGEK
ncbi:hypothetical protein DL770_000342 [Monosporascus sp. CRB-9-2]|nr:hypothetical protein DL770_000342 [Monosporascus sp. CRB-9-2]